MSQQTLKHTRQVPTLLKLAQSLPEQTNMEDAFDLFIDWTLELGIELYPAQEEGIMEVMSDHHVILNTPTGSGKSMVALGAPFWAFAHGQRSVDHVGYARMDHIAFYRHMQSFSTTCR